MGSSVEVLREQMIFLLEQGLHDSAEMLGPGKTGRSTIDHLEPVRWLQKFADGHSSIAAHDNEGALEHFHSLGQRFPNNPHLLLESAKAELTVMKNDEAAHSFEKARQIDQFNVSSMDEYAMLLRTRGEQMNLNRLVHELINVDATRPEVWVAAAVYWEILNSCVIS